MRSKELNAIWHLRGDAFVKALRHLIAVDLSLGQMRLRAQRKWEAKRGVVRP